MTAFASQAQATAFNGPINRRKLPRVPSQEQLDSWIAPFAKQVQVDLKAAYIARRERRTA